MIILKTSKDYRQRRTQQNPLIMGRCTIEIDTKSIPHLSPCSHKSAVQYSGTRSDSMREVGTKICFFVNLSQLKDFMPTLLKTAHSHSRLLLLKRKSTRKRVAGPWLRPCALTEMSHNLLYRLANDVEKIP